MDVGLWVQGQDLDDDLRASLAGDVRDLLLPVDDIADVHLVAKTGLPAGAKAGEILEWGSLLVSLGSAASFRVMVDVLASWLRRQPQDISIEIDGAKLSGAVTAKERQELVDSFLSRVRKTPDRAHDDA